MTLVSERNNMYNSPIDIIADQMRTQMEADMLKCVRQYGFKVNQEELTKALAYDRQQYNKGFKDGYNQAVETFKDMIRTVNLIN